MLQRERVERFDEIADPLRAVLAPLFQARQDQEMSSRSFVLSKSLRPVSMRKATAPTA